MSHERILYWYEYKKWIDSNMESARKIGRRCMEIVFKKCIPAPEEGESDELSDEELNIIFGL